MKPNKEQKADSGSESMGIAKPIVRGGASSNRITYVRNCFYWIEQYFQNEVSQAKAIEAVESLMNHIVQHRC